MPSLSDLNVYRTDSEKFDVYSHLTRGRCATVYKFKFSDNYVVQPFLTATYMQGISSLLILQAVEQFVEKEKCSPENSPSVAEVAHLGR